MEIWPESLVFMLRLLYVYRTWAILTNLYYVEFQSHTRNKFLFEKRQPDECPVANLLNDKSKVKTTESFKKAYNRKKDNNYK